MKVNSGTTLVKSHRKIDHKDKCENGVSQKGSHRKGVSSVSLGRLHIQFSNSGIIIFRRSLMSYRFQSIRP